METTNQVKKTKSFDNLRTLSQINNNDLSKMNESAKKLRAQIENISKTIRDLIKSNSTVQNKGEAEQEAVVRQANEVEITQKVQQKIVRTEQKSFEKREITQKSFDIRQYACKIFMQSNKKSDCASARQ